MENCTIKYDCYLVILQAAFHYYTKRALPLFVIYIRLLPYSHFYFVWVVISSRLYKRWLKLTQEVTRVNYFKPKSNIDAFVGPDAKRPRQF